MKKELKDMTQEELWQLFPIFLVPYNTDWPLWYEDMARRLNAAIPNGVTYRISHIGSTSIGTIWAKNIVDIMLEVERNAALNSISAAAESIGFVRMFTEPGRISLNYGYTPEGFAERVYHLHIRYFGDNDELYFRDILRGNEAVAREYEALKLSLWKQYEHDRDAYTEAKTDFIRKYTNRARTMYEGRY